MNCACVGTQVTQLCLTLDALLESENSSAEVLECYFLEALYCSLGATLLEDDRVKFDEFIKGLSCLTTVYEEKELAEPGQIPGKGKICYNAFLNSVLFYFIYPALLLSSLNVFLYAGYLPTLYDFHFDGVKEKWVPWSSLVTKYIHDPKMKFADILGKD